LPERRTAGNPTSATGGQVGRCVRSVSDLSTTVALRLGEGRDSRFGTGSLAGAGLAGTGGQAWHGTSGATAAPFHRTGQQAGGIEYVRAAYGGVLPRAGCA